MANIDKKLKFDEDHETWEEFKTKENFRWLFNKLEVALRQNLHAGPAGTAPLRKGTYISRPIYNTYGMGIGAKKFEYDPATDYENFINHAVVPPGHFWCEWLTGPHVSIDYQTDKPNTWEVRSIWYGTHFNDENLTKFESWERLSNESAPNPYLLPLRFPWWGVELATLSTRAKIVWESSQLRPFSQFFVEHLDVFFVLG
jgi:hypothetical protein